MLSNFDYLWKGLLCVCVNSTFGRCCDCCKKEETLYFKIDKTGQDDDRKKCFNNTWYKACKDRVLLLEEVNADGPNVLRVIGSGDKWEITDPQENKFKDDKCDSGNNKWIIVKVTTLKDDSEGAVDSFIFYVDEITSVVDGNNDFYGVFEDIQCYSIEIIAANTRAVQDMSSMFYEVYSQLEEDKGKDPAPGLIGLDKLNVESVTDINKMFDWAIFKQATLNQLKKWHFSGGKDVCITNLFNSKVEGLNFTVLDGWNKPKDNGAVSFWLDGNFTKESVFKNNSSGNDFKPPRWYGSIGERMIPS